MQKNIFVVGLDPLNLAQLHQLRHAKDYCYRELGSYEEVQCGSRLPVREILKKSENIPRDFSTNVDALIGYLDFPVSTMLPLLRRPYGLPGPSLETVLKCEHKFWSRREQRAVIGDVIPDFCDVDPFGPEAADKITLGYPFWLKPVKSHSSYMGYLVRDRRELERSLASIRRRIGKLAEPFNLVLDYADLPDDVAQVDGYHCIAESIISRGEQCTLEGYVHDGVMRVYGVVDSVREGRNRSSFSRYQYPSRLPEPVQQRMIDVSGRFLRHIGYDDSPFNIEFFWDPDEDRIWLLEVNTRISKSHCLLFQLVDGEYHHAVAVDIALGRKPDFPYREGFYRMAAKFMLRRKVDGIVRAVPSESALERVRQRFPGSQILVFVQPGMRLSELADQDSYSYEIAVLFMGADAEDQLIENYRKALELLPFVIEET